MQVDRENSPLIQQSKLNRRVVNWWTMLLKPCFAEYVGTTLFVFAGVLSAFHANDNFTIVNVALGHGLALFVMVSATAAISGGHLNPAVTLGVFCTGTLSPGVALGYVAAQLLGGITASGLAKGLLHKTQAGYSFALTEPWVEETNAQAIFTETFLTAILVLTVLTLAVETRGQNQVAPLAIGMAVAAAIFAGGDVSGASMNPARSFGPALVFNTWGRVWIYFIGPPIGAILASLVYRFILSKRKLPIPILTTFQQRQEGN